MARPSSASKSASTAAAAATSRAAFRSSSFERTGKTKFTGTFGFGLSFYPSDFVSFGVEYRAIPFSWNRAGFDSRGSGPNDNFPDGQVNGEDETFKFNQFVTVNLGFSFPTQPKISE